MVQLIQDPPVAGIQPLITIVEGLHQEVITAGVQTLLQAEVIHLAAVVLLLDQATLHLQGQVVAVVVAEVIRLAVVVHPDPVGAADRQSI